MYVKAKAKALWAELLPSDLRLGEFEESSVWPGQRYRYGAWNADGDWIMAWNTHAEFMDGLASLGQEGGFLE